MTSSLEPIRRAAQQLRAAERPVRILQAIAWPASVRERFLADGAKKLPVVRYASFDPAPTLAAVAEVRAALTAMPRSLQGWFERLCEAIGTGARMLAALGTPDFYHHSRALFGAPQDTQPDEDTTALQLARTLTDILAMLGHVDLGAPAPACHLAEEVARRMRDASLALFGDSSPEIEIVDELSANALAGGGRIRIRRTAQFTDRDIEQLIQHEAYIHMATSLNGRAQNDLPILASSHPGTTRTQEGLAVFAEFITGTMEIDRLRRLADRIIAIQMAIDGADFLDVYRFFLDHAGSREQAYENTRRVFRGGVLSGGAPCTKDIVYLDGLLRVHNFLRSVVASGRSDCLRLLFCGKLDIDDIPALAELAALGLCRRPQFVPPWARDLRFLLAYLAYSSFLNRVNLPRIRERYGKMLADAPKVELA